MVIAEHSDLPWNTSPSLQKLCLEKWWKSWELHTSLAVFSLTSISGLIGFCQFLESCNHLCAFFFMTTLSLECLYDLLLALQSASWSKRLQQGMSMTSPCCPPAPTPAAAGDQLVLGHFELMWIHWQLLSPWLSVPTPIVSLKKSWDHPHSVCFWRSFLMFQWLFLIVVQPCPALFDSPVNHHARNGKTLNLPIYFIHPRAADMCHRLLRAKGRWMLWCGPHWVVRQTTPSPCWHGAGLCTMKSWGDWIPDATFIAVTCP